MHSILGLDGTLGGGGCYASVELGSSQTTSSCPMLHVRQIKVMKVLEDLGGTDSMP